MAAERALVDFAVARACERHAIVFELIYSRGCVSAQILNRVLVPEPVRSLDGVVHVPAPVVRPLVTERGPNATFGRDGVRASGKDLRDAGGWEARLDAAERRSKPSATGADDHDVIGMIRHLIGSARNGWRTGMWGRRHHTSSSYSDGSCLSITVLNCSECTTIGLIYIASS